MTVRMMHFRITKDEFWEVFSALVEDLHNGQDPPDGSVTQRFQEAWINGLECPSL